jgi:hypothetical protein
LFQAWHYNTELRFDLASTSLKTLPVATKEQQLQTRVQVNKSVDTDLVEEAAKVLKESLGLTIFGFDVVVSILHFVCMMVLVFTLAISHYGSYHSLIRICKIG